MTCETKGKHAHCGRHRDAAACAKSKHCVFDALARYCRAANGTLPCKHYTTAAHCIAQPACRYDAAAGACVPQGEFVTHRYWLTFFRRDGDVRQHTQPAPLRAGAHVCVRRQLRDVRHNGHSAALPDVQNQCERPGRLHIVLIASRRRAQRRPWHALGNLWRRSAATRRCTLRWSASTLRSRMCASGTRRASGGAIGIPS